MKGQLTRSSVLAYPVPEGHLILDADASLYGLAAVISQEQGGAEGSGTLSRPERNYCVMQKELLGVIFGLLKYRH